MAGVRLWTGGSAYFNPEIDQGFGLSNTLGIAGFPSGEAYKIGANAPYIRIPRAFIRQVFNLGGEVHSVESAPNQISEAITANNLIVTLGKFSVTDVFDINTYAHDPRADFLNWTVIDSGTFDYAADSWGFTYGAAAEWTQDWWTARLGIFDLSTIPNGKQPDPDFGEFEGVLELEERHHWGDHPGKLKVLVFANHGRMGSYTDAVAFGALTGTIPSTAAVRRFQTREGIELNLEQELATNVGGFLRLGVDDGSKEDYDFTDVNRSVSTGLSIKGALWGRGQDAIGIAAVQNGLDKNARTYFADGGLGILIGDGQLNYGPERILETYYALHLITGVTATLDYQWVDHPAYNRDRGPVSIVAVRLHAQF
jgi:high affinity Mn2+ porin